MTLETTYTLSDPRTAHDNALLDELAGIITNGIESGYIQYWAGVTSYSWGDQPEHLPGREFYAVATIREHNEESDPAGWSEEMFLLNAESLLPAVLRIVNGTAGLGAWSDLPGRLLALLRTPQGEHDFDAEDADILIQLAVLGELRYG